MAGETKNPWWIWIDGLFSPLQTFWHYGNTKWTDFEINNEISAKINFTIFTRKIKIDKGINHPGTEGNNKKKGIWGSYMMHFHCDWIISRMKYYPLYQCLPTFLAYDPLKLSNVYFWTPHQWLWPKYAVQTKSVFFSPSPIVSIGFFRDLKRNKNPVFHKKKTTIIKKLSEEIDRILWKLNFSYP